jgi:uncharacterized protein YjbJ (UPF0337 family)
MCIPSGNFCTWACCQTPDLRIAAVSGVWPGSCIDINVGLPKRRREMKSSQKDKIKGTLHETKGKLKETAGQLTNNPNLAADGRSEKLAGKVQKKIGQIEKVFEK